MHGNLASRLEKQFSQAILDAFGEAAPADVTQSAEEKFGHYQCNSALKLSKQLRMNPRAVAEKIIAHLGKDGMISHLEIAGPGFINITLAADFLSKETGRILQDPHLGVAVPPREKIIVEFSSPNVAKELHVGHLRSTIIGDCLARVFEFLDQDVLRLNHVGDWGTQFGMLIAYMQEHAPEVLEGKKTADLPLLMHWYKESKKQFDADAAFKKRAQLQVVQLQSGDSALIHAWKIICDISRKAYQEIYALLDIKITERGESFYNPMLPKIVADLEQKGLITPSDGAKCMFLEGFEVPVIVQKADGGYNYDTTDMAALYHRVTVEKAKRMIYVVDLGQGLHFQLIFKAAEKAGFFDPAKVTVEHVPFGVVLGPDGKKFKTRSGETEKLIDLLLEAVKQARHIFEERMPDAAPSELDASAKVLGIGAVKYSDLSCNRVKDYVFSYERMLKFEGNTAAFMLYAYVRIQSIKRKVNKEISALTAPLALEHPSEIALGLHLCRFGETLESVVRDLLPNRLTDYLYDLAEKFHAFFRDCRVEGSPQEESRLLLCETTGRILKQGLNLLGLETLERM